MQTSAFAFVSIKSPELFFVRDAREKQGHVRFSFSIMKSYSLLARYDLCALLFTLLGDTAACLLEYVRLAFIS